MTTDNQQSMDGFFAPSGGASLKVALFALGVLVFGGVFLKQVHPLAPVVSIGIAMLSGIVAVVLGVLSLFGVAKLNGTSRPVAGLFGILLGGLAASILLLLLPAVHAARAAADWHHFQQDFAEMTGENPNQESIYCAGGKLKLRKPGYRWVLGQEEACGRFYPGSEAVALHLPAGSDTPITAAVVTEPLPEMDEITFEAFVEGASAQFEQNGYAKSSSKEEEFQGERSFLITFTAVGETDKGSEMASLRCLFHANHMIRLICGGPADEVEAASVSFAEAITLLP